MRTKVSKQLSAVAGMATSPLSPVAKAAQKHLVGVIQGKNRVERQAAIRQAVAQQARDSRLPKTNPEHGKHVWVYSQRGTGRVIYSLTREVDNDKAMAQLTFVGKKSVPSHIRPDMWNPFAIVTFPTATQGLEAFRVLREFRMRHEYEWRDHLKDRNDLPGKQKRMRMLQNQKPNTVADLAATLALQERLGKQELEKRVDQLRQDEEQYEATLRQLEELEAKIEYLDNPNASAEAESSIEKTSKSRSDLQTERSKLKMASSEYSKRRSAASQALDAATKEADSLTFAANEAGEGQDSSREAFIQRRQVELLPGYLAELRNYGALPKRGARRSQMIRELLPDRQTIPTLEGVKIVWADAHNRDYAESWPAQVEHEIMGVMKGTAPHPEHLRADAQWTDRAVGLLEKYQAQGQEPLSKDIEQWEAAEAGEYLDYLKVLYQQQKKRLEPFLRKIIKLEKLDDVEMATRYEVTAAEMRVKAMEQIVKAIEVRTSDGKAVDAEESSAQAADVSRNVNHSLTVAANLTRRAQILRGEVSSENVKHLSRSEHLRRTLDTEKGQARLAYLRQRLSNGRSLSAPASEWLASALQMSKDGGTSLTPEEEEHMANVELDGESSGKNEEEVEEDDEPNKSKNDGKLEKERQEAEKKGLWGRMFSQSSTSSRSDGPRT